MNLVLPLLDPRSSASPSLAFRAQTKFKESLRQRFLAPASLFLRFAPILALLMLPAIASTQTSMTVPVNTINEPVGTKSTAHTASVTITTAGTLSNINVLTEGQNNLDFQLSSYSCSPGATLTVGQVCTIGYTYQPQVAGLRRGGITLNDSNGNPLGIAYVAGYGTGSQPAAYAATNGIANQQLIISSIIYGQFALDGFGNVYYGGRQNGVPVVFKATPNASGAYISAVIGSSNTASIGNVAVDGLGNVFFDDSYTNASLNEVDCAIGKLTPGNSGYTKSDPILLVGMGQCASNLAIDGNGTIYFYDDAAIAVESESFNAGTYSHANVGSLYERGSDDLAVDAEHNVYFVDCAGDGGENPQPDVIFEWNPSSNSYTGHIYGAAQNPENATFGQQCGVAAGNNGGYWMSDSASNANSGSGSSTIYYFTPTSSNFSNYAYTFQQFSANNVFIGPIRLDGQGNVYFANNSAQGTQGIYKISVSPTLTYPATTSGAVSASQDLVFANLGTSSLSFSSISKPSFVQTISANNANGLPDCQVGATFAPGVSCDYRTEFAPASSASGLQSGFIFFDNNSFKSPVYDGVQGTANHPLPTVTSVSPSNGDSKGGTTVTITGTYLGDATGVSFNSTPAASVTQINATQMSAVAPAGTADSYATISVTNPGGTGTSSSNLWHWDALPSTASSTLSLSQSSIVQNGTTTITATILGASGSSTPNQPLSNAIVNFNSSNQNVAVSAQATTNASGVATATITGSFPGTTTFTATVEGSTLTAAPVLNVAPPTVAVGTTLSGLAANVVFTRAGVPVTFTLLSKNNANELGFSGYSCYSGASLPVGATCTVDYTFTPVAPGLRQGSITISDSAGNVLGQTFIPGIGSGAQGLFTNPSTYVLPTAHSNLPSAAVDDAGNVYYTNQTAETVSKINARGSITTLASGINTVTGVAVDGAGNVFYGAYGANEVYELVGGSGTPQAIASVTNPDIGMATDGAGNIYVSSPQQVIKIDAITHATTKVGSASGYVPGVAVDAAGNVYYTDTSNNLIYRTPAGSTTGSVIVSSGLNSPRGITVDPAGDLYIASQNGQSLTRLTAGTWAATTVASGYAFNSVVMDQYGTLYSAGSSEVLALSRSAASLTLPTTPANSTSPTSLIPFENDGNTALPITSVSASAPFTLSSVSNQCATGSLPVAAICELGIGFAPTAYGAFNGTASVAQSTVTHTIALSGTATALSQTITFPALTTPATAGSQVTLSATASSGLAVSYSVTGPASLSGSVLTYTGIGNVVITASQAGNSVYAAATQAVQTIVVQAGAPLVFLVGSGHLGTLDSRGDVASSAASGGGVGLAVDQYGYVWSANGSSLTSFTNLGVVSHTYTPGGLNAATALATDGNSAIWVANGDGSTSEVSNAGTTLLTTAAKSAAPSAIAIDTTGGVWVISKSGNSVTRLFGSAAPVTTPIAAAVANSSVGTKP